MKLYDLIFKKNPITNNFDDFELHHELLDTFFNQFELITIKNIFNMQMDIILEMYQDNDFDIHLDMCFWVILQSCLIDSAINDTKYPNTPPNYDIVVSNLKKELTTTKGLFKKKLIYDKKSLCNDLVSCLDVVLNPQSEFMEKYHNDLEIISEVEKIKSRLENICSQ